MNFYLINPDAEHRGILLIKYLPEITTFVKFLGQTFGEPMGRGAVIRGKTSWNLKPA
jgi:hypothetical protein